MSDSFEGVVAALWASLGLGPPTLSGDRFELSVDGRAIRLAPSPSGRQVIVSGEIGRLAEDPVRRAGQVRQLLRESLGLLLDGRASLQVAGEAAAVVDAQAACPMRADRTDALRAAIEDVLLVIDMHEATLRRQTPAPRHAPSQAAGAEPMIFRP